MLNKKSTAVLAALILTVPAAFAIAPKSITTTQATAKAAPAITNANTLGFDETNPEALEQTDSTAQPTTPAAKQPAPDTNAQNPTDHSHDKAQLDTNAKKKS